MARQIKVSVKAVKKGVETLQVLGSNVALCNCWLEMLAVRHEGRKAGRQVDGQPTALSVR